MIHNKFLKKICDESDLKGLVYHGGPKVVCRQCEWRGVLTCVGYPDETEYSAEVNCKECNEQYNTEELLRLQVSHDYNLQAHIIILTCAVILHQVLKKEKTSRTNYGKCQLTADIQSPTVSSSMQPTLGNVEPRIIYCVHCLYTTNTPAMHGHRINTYLKYLWSSSFQTCWLYYMN